MRPSALATSLLPVSGSLVSAYPIFTATQAVSPSIALRRGADTNFNPTRTPSKYSLGPPSPPSHPEDVPEQDSWLPDTLGTYSPRRQVEGTPPLEGPGNGSGYPDPETSNNDDQTQGSSRLTTWGILGIIGGVGGAAAVTSVLIGDYSDKHPGEITKRACNAWKGARSLCSRAIPGSRKGLEQPTEQSLELGPYDPIDTQWIEDPSHVDQLEAPPPSYHDACMVPRSSILT